MNIIIVKKLLNFLHNKSYPTEKGSLEYSNPNSFSQSDIWITILILLPICDIMSSAIGNIC